MSLLRKTSAGFAKTVFRLSVYLLIIIALFYGSSFAYNYGLKVFSTKTMEEEPGTDLTITVENGTSVSDMGKILEDYGLIEDHKIFWLQSKIFELSYIKPGTYVFNTSMTSEELIAMLSNGETVYVEDAEEDATESTTEE